MPAESHATISAAAARRWLLDGQGMLADPARRAGPAATRRLLQRMGYVQVDTISVMERAHHHVLMSRLDGYRHEHLNRLLERDRVLFEHWTHDASIIIVDWYPYWQVRFDRHRRMGPTRNAWWRKQIGDDAETVIAHVRERIESEGPLMSRDFAAPVDRGSGPWWGWKPSKVALEYLWRSGEVAISERRNFQKVYDLAERVHPGAHGLPAPTSEEHRAWACRVALERLGAATPGEIAEFTNAIRGADVVAWSRDAIAAGEVKPVALESAGAAPPVKGLAVVDFERRVRRLPDAPDRMRLLSPFDPIIRNRARLLRLFDFEYRFEGFVPAAKRRFGYYVLPILDGDRFVGRFDGKLHRDRAVLEGRGLWWEAGTGADRSLRRRLAPALDIFTEQIGGERWALPGSSGRVDPPATR